ncbi:MAG: sodium-translocating pyrophosphatase [Clostridia bacterium]|nr:sodium-translocating pyrophosphatase [Clostridia bacterium]
MENLFWIGFVGAALAGGYALLQTKKVLSFSEGTSRMKQIAGAIREGANAYLHRQYKTVLPVFAVIFVILTVMAFASGGKMLSKFTPFAFLTGGIWSLLAGFIGMKIATHANARTAQAASEGLNRGLRVAFSAGSVMGFTVVALGILDITLWFVLLRYVFGVTSDTMIGNIMVMNGMGASFMALFARVGGGIYTKAADVGADLVGKVEKKIPEDDPRNPATIADNVGDNVGDVAGMGADLYESYVGSILATFALSAIGGYGFAGMFLPMMLAVTGILCSIIGAQLVRVKENATQKTLLRTLRTGTYTAAALSAVLALPLTYLTFHGVEGSTVFPGIAGTNWFGIYAAILSGLAAGCMIGFFTEFFTSESYRPTRNLAATSQTGYATIIIGGISLGMESALTSILIVCAAVLVSYFAAGGSTAIVDANGHFLETFNRGLYGIGIAGVGMLSTLGITLATDAYGPVADNAGGIAQMAGMDPVVRERTDALDSLGNTTAATGKGFAIGSASLTSLALLVSYVNIIQDKTDAVLNFSIINPTVLIGMFIGAMLVFVFSAVTMNGVERAAQKVVIEVRRQFREIPGILEGTATPEYGKCVSICTKGALREMVVPACMAVIVPILAGLILGPTGVVGLLAGVSVAGFAVSVFMSNAGGAWDNAKKYIEEGHFGGKGSKPHKASVVGDTIGDPFKDTSGPSLNILIKLCATVSIVFSGLIALIHLL